MAKVVRLPHSEPPVPDPGRPATPAPGRAFLPLERIGTATQRTRDLNPRHVLALAESIAAVGLIHPPAVDRADRLLAGAHRLAALRWLQGNDAPRFLELFPAGIPVWRMDLDADSDVDLALAVEISENERRRDYSTGEIQRLADRLKAAGFSYSAGGGRPRGEARPLMPALEIIVGKSVRQLRRVLNPAPERKPVMQKTRTHDLVYDLNQMLASSDRLIVQLSASAEVPELFSLKAQLERVNRLARAALAVLPVR